MRLIKKYCSAFAMITMLIMSVIKVEAYEYVGYRWESSIIKYSYSGWMFPGGASSWSGLDAAFQNVSTYYDVNCLIVSDSEAKWDGTTRLKIENLHITSATIMINSAKSATWNDKEALKSVASHEFGHALGLDDVMQEYAVMNGATWGGKSRYGEYKLTTPTQEEKDAINSIY